MPDTCASEGPQVSPVALSTTEGGRNNDYSNETIRKLHERSTWASWQSSFLAQLEDPQFNGMCPSRIVLSHAWWMPGMERPEKQPAHWPGSRRPAHFADTQRQRGEHRVPSPDRHAWTGTMIAPLGHPVAYIHRGTTTSSSWARPVLGKTYPGLRPGRGRRPQLHAAAAVCPPCRSCLAETRRSP